MRRHASRHGYTLFEVSLSLAVLILLVGLFYNIFFHIRENGLRTSCQDHLRRLALAVSQYVEDQDGAYPAPGQWTGTLLPYAKLPEVFYCPAVSSRTGSTDYWINPQLNQVKFVKNGAARATTFLNGDLSAKAEAVSGSCGTNTYYIRHLNGANYSFVDGHVKWLKPEDAYGYVCPK